ncbi:MAG: segregation ATPase FtsK/SpoIIIE, family [Actinomycetota bacterium]|nr:segregation ATPase FtsK/SpoIIIE, family [Actinomycetota bacterium]
MELSLGVAAPRTKARADVRVRYADGSAFGDVAEGLLSTVSVMPAAGSFTIAGKRVADTDLLGFPPLVEGALLEIDAASRPTQQPELLELHVVGGPAAGAIHVLAPGQVVIGRSGQVCVDDPDVSREHCRLRLDHTGAKVIDLSSTNGTAVDGITIQGETALPTGGLLRVGSSTLQLVPAAEPPAPTTPTGDGRLAYNRPPRLQPSDGTVQVVVPAPPDERERNPIPVLAVLAPLVLGVVMWRVMGNATFLLFTLLSPVLVLGNVATDYRRGKRQTRKQRALWRAQRDVAEQTLADAVRADEGRRRQQSPDAAELLRTAAGPRPRLWERRRGDADALDVRIGLADQAARVEAEGDVTRAMTTARSVPVVIPLRTAGVLGIAGPRDSAQGLARFVLAQLAVLHSPRDLQIVVITDGAAASSWEWPRWLPHCRPDGRQSCRATVGLGIAQATARVAELCELIDARKAERASAGPRARTDERPVVLLVDGARGLRSIPGLAALLAEGPAAGIFTVAVEQDPRLLPEECGATAVFADEPGALVHATLPGSVDVSAVTADLVSLMYGETLARALAPLRDDSRDRGSADGLPSSVRWTEVVDMTLTGGHEDVAQVLARWAAAGHSTTAVLGRGPDGPFTVDIARDGPHMLVAGTTGSGKSELLQSLIASLALGNRPDELNLLLVDFKGGAAFGPCAHLPHTVGMVTDLDGARVERAIASLTAELRRREAALAAVGTKDLDDYRRHGHADLPRLVIVVDEFASLADELPDFVGGLVGIAQRGRSLGVHLVLATQRPEGVVSADIRANTNLRLCLGVTRESESRDVIDSPAAAGISRGTPGRAYARTGHADLTPFQTGRVGGRRPSVVSPDAAPIVLVDPAVDLGEPIPLTPSDRLEETTDLSLLVDACRSAAERLRMPAARSPWLPPLPELLCIDEVAAPDEQVGRPGRVAPLVFGLCDVPDSQTRRPLALDLDTSSHLMILGSPRSGRTTALRTIAGAVARSASADDVHVYAIDPGGSGLGALADLPHTGAVVTREQTERLERLLSFLVAEVARRQAALGAAGQAGITEQRASAHPADRLPHLLLLLDRWEAFVTTYQDLDGGRLLDLMYRLLREGPSAGLHIVLTADRSGLVGRVSSMVEDRLVLRLADPGDYAGAGIATRLVPSQLPPGRGWSTSTGPLVAQVALLTEDPAGPAQTTTLSRLAAQAGRASVCPPRRVEVLPTTVALSALPRGTGSRVVLGVGGDELVPLEVDLSGSGFLVAGPPRSGRSSALMAMATQLQAEGTRVVAVAPRPSALRALPGCHTDPDASYDLDAALGTGRVALVVDDAELLVDSAVAHLLERTTRQMRDTGSLVVVAGTTDELVTGFRGFVVDVRRSRSGVLLSPQGPADGDLLGVRLSRGIGGDISPGRGLLCRQGRTQPVQLAHV